MPSRARGGSASGVKSVYPDPKARSNPRRKSLRGTFARLSVRKHRKRQVLGNSARAQLDQSAASAVFCSANARNCSKENLAVDWFNGIRALLFEFRQYLTNQLLVLVAYICHSKLLALLIHYFIS